LSDATWIAEAARLGQAARGRTAPNPNVGCVIVRDGEIVARGATAPGGRPHAEAVALAAAWETQTKTQARSLEGKIKRLPARQKRDLVAGTPVEELMTLKDPVHPVRVRRTPA